MKKQFFKTKYIFTLTKSLQIPLLSLFFILFACNASAADLKILSGQQMIKAINQDKNPSKVIFMFASWCGYCKQALPQLVSLTQGDLKGKLQVFYISLDHNYDAIAKFSQALDQNITIYHMTKVEDIMDFFNTFSIKYNNSVPHITILDNQGNTLADGRGSIASVEKKVRKYLGQVS